MDKILVLGDLVVDWIDIPIKHKSGSITGSNTNSNNWQLTPGTRRIATGGGSYLIYDLLTHLHPNKVTGEQFDVNHIPGNSVCIQSYFRIEDFHKKEKKEVHGQLWRVSEFLGYDGPESPVQPEIKLSPDDHHKLVIIDDAANGLRDSESTEKIMDNVNGLQTIIYKLVRPYSEETEEGDHAGLWRKVMGKHHSANSNLIVLLDANDLRNEGAPLSFGLSWERFASDVVHHFKHSRFQRFREGLQNAWIIVKAGLEGAVILPPGFLKEDSTHAVAPILVYHPLKCEGDSFDEYREKGKMTGYFAVFTAAIGHVLFEAGQPDEKTVVKAVKSGLNASIKLLKAGFCCSKDFTAIAYPIDSVSSTIASDDAMDFQAVAVPVFPKDLFGHQDSWTIAETLKLRGIVKIAEQLVRHDDQSTKNSLPRACFGKLTTYDKSEIESYRTIKRLVREYCEAGVANRPLSIGVFGKPGSGKSFGVTQVVKSLLADDTPVRTFNMSEFQSPDELSRAFHIIHDFTRDGTIPLVFFDEFDCSLKGDPCGWLKYFLAPMQDGQFNDGSDIHPVGRAIFVFAGGTKSCYKDFADQEHEPERWFSKAKGPDFLSRLRGYVNIMGVNPAHDKDFICLIRRASLIRKELLDRGKTLGIQSHWLVNDKKEIIIESAVLHALLKAPLFTNGARSLSAIIESCQLSLSKGLTKASLPPKHILAMHLDVKRFLELVYAEDFERQVFLPARERMARMVHEQYCKENPDSITAVPWSQLSLEDQMQNYYQVDSYCNTLLEAGYCLELKDITGLSDDVESVLENLAIAEHNRWMRDKIRQGFRYGDNKSKELKTHPNIVEWQNLKPEDQQKDYDAMSYMVSLLEISGLKVVKCKE